MSAEIIVAICVPIVLGIICVIAILRDKKKK